MAVAMEVSPWRGPSDVPGPASSPVRKKRAWGADAQQLMQLMMKQLQHSPSETSELTLDLLGNADSTAAAASAASPSSQREMSPDFLHLDPADTMPLPSGWEKCLDLQTGELYYMNKNLGVSTFYDPRKRQRRALSSEFHNQQPVVIELPTTAVVQHEPEPPQVAHEFLASKKSETESFHVKGGYAFAASGGHSTSSSSGSPPLQRPRGIRLSPFSQQEQHLQQLPHQLQQTYPQHQQHPWSFHHHCLYFAVVGTPTNSRGVATAAAAVAEDGDDSHVELDLNLSAGGGGLQSNRRRSASPRVFPQAVCTVEMVQDALRRSSENININRVAVTREEITAAPRMKQQPIKGSGSSSFSSLTNSTTRSEPSAASPAASSTSSASSRSGAMAPSSAGVFEAESTKVESVVMELPPALVMGACTRCLMYVMLNKAEPRCPRCDNNVSVEFVAPSKTPTGGLKLGLGAN